MTEREQLCKEFTELTGGQYHDPDIERNIYHPYMCSCGRTYGDFDHLISHCISENPTYENPADVLRSIIKSGLYNEFMAQYGGLSKFGRHLDSILVDLIIEQDALLKAAVEFLIERKK